MTREIVSTYEEDFFAWTQDQATALRRAKAGAVPDGIDIGHLAEEIEDLGRRDLRDVTSNLARLFEHLIIIVSAPATREAAHWHGEALRFQIAAASAFSGSMRRLIDLQRLWEQGRRRAEAMLTQMAMPTVAPGPCPFALDDVLVETFDLDGALRRVAASAG